MQDDNLQKINSSGTESAFIRYGRGILLVLSMSINGFIFGGWFSAQFIVSKNAGLAGGAEVAFGGFIAAFLSIFISIVLLRRLSGKRLLQIMIASVITLLILIGVIAI